MKKANWRDGWWIVCIVLIICTTIITDNIYCAATYAPEETIQEEAKQHTATYSGQIKTVYWEEEVKELKGVKTGAITPVASAPKYSPEELEMLACVIYQEAGADYICDDCRRRVADVVLNRAADPRFPDTIKGVLTQRSQYGRFYWTGVVWPERAALSQEAHAVDRAYRIAREVLEGQHSELYGNGYIWQAEFKQGTGHVRHCGIIFGK